MKDDIERCVPRAHEHISAINKKSLFPKGHCKNAIPRNWENHSLRVPINPYFSYTNH